MKDGSLVVLTRVWKFGVIDFPHYHPHTYKRKVLGLLNKGDIIVVLQLITEFDGWSRCLTKTGAGYLYDLEQKVFR